jgi:hypothetical protein
MSDRAQTLISWTPPDEGGRSAPPAGPVYTTVCRFEEDENWPGQAWSLVIHFRRPLRDQRHLHAEVEFLAPEAPSHLLRRGNRFELFEGRRKVAKGVILPSSLSVPEELSPFESALIG